MLAPHQLDSAATAATATGMNFPVTVFVFVSVSASVSVCINTYERPFFPSLICLFLLPIYTQKGNRSPHPPD